MNTSDKVIFLFDRETYTEQEIGKLTWKDCEEWIAEEDYNENYSIVKIDANGYDSIDNAITEEGFDKDEYIIKSFGF